MGYRVITGSSDSRAIVWEAVDSLAVVESWSIAHERGVVAVAISADARVVATADKTKALRLYDAEKQETLQIWSSAHSGQINALALAADGERLASASREEVRVFLLGEKEAVQVLGPHRAIVRAILFHEDGERLVSGDENGDIYLWDVDAAEVLIELTAHEAAITSLAFVDGGRTLLSGDASGVVLAWRSERLPERYQRWEQSERRQLREQGIMRYFEGDHELAHERLLEGVAGLHADDPAVQSLLKILTPSAEQVEPASGE
jgi:WD40 repeat protein